MYAPPNQRLTMTATVVYGRIASVHRVHRTVLRRSLGAIR